MILLRSTVFNILFFAVSLVITLLATAVRAFAPDRVLGAAILWARCLVVLARIVCGIRLDVRGLEHIPQGAALIASRHQSAFDTFVWLTLLPRCCYVFKQELGRIPLFGPLIGAAGMIAVNRDGGGNAIRELLREADRAVREQRQIVIFPEGTRGEPGGTVVLQAGIAAIASRTRLPVIPVSTDSGLYWGRKAFRKRPGTVRIVVGQPIPPQIQRKALMRALEDGLLAIDREKPGATI
jgi:1-acyl-sn-glycerol-3-phosphate acyltransferase